MGLGRLLTRGRQIDNRAAGAGFQVIIDGNPVNYPTSFYRGGMAIPGAWRAALMITDLLGSVPWDAYREDSNGMPVDKISPRPPLLAQPAPPDTAMTTFSSLGLDLIWHGNAVGIWADFTDGLPSAVLPIPAEEVGVRRIGAEAKSALPVGAIEYNIGGLSYAPWEVLHVKGPCPPSEIRGFGVLEAHLTGLSNPQSAGTLDLARELQRQAQAVSQHGVPTGYLKTTNPDTEPAALKAAKVGWLEAQRDRTIAALNASIEFEPIAWNPTEAQLIEARKMSLLETALLFGVQPSALGVETSNRTYRNDNAEDIKFAKWGLRGHVFRFQATLSEAFPPGTQVVADLRSITDADVLTSAQADEIEIRSRTLTPNEARAKRGRQPLPGGDEFPAAPVAVDNQQENTDDQQQDDPGDQAGEEGGQP